MSRPKQHLVKPPDMPCLRGAVRSGGEHTAGVKALVWGLTAPTSVAAARHACCGLMGNQGTEDGPQESSTVPKKRTQRSSNLTGTYYINMMHMFLE